MRNVKYTPPKFVIVDDGSGHSRKRLTKASWNHDTMALYMLENGTVGWLKVGDIARDVWERNTHEHRQRVRKRLSNLKKHMVIVYNKLLVVEYNDPRGAASAMKVYDPDSSSDVQAMEKMLIDMKVKKDKMLDYYKRFTGLSGVDPENENGNGGEEEA